MLVLREQQMQALTRGALPHWIADHLKQFFPEECAAIGEIGLLECVRQGITRAESHGFETEVQISQYVDLMFAFGADFDTDPTLSWPQPILSDPTLSAILRIERLVEAGCRHRQGA